MGEAGPPDLIGDDDVQDEVAEDLFGSEDEDGGESGEKSESPGSGDTRGREEKTGEMGGEMGEKKTIVKKQTGNPFLVDDSDDEDDDEPKAKR